MGDLFADGKYRFQHTVYSKPRCRKVVLAWYSSTSISTGQRSDRIISLLSLGPRWYFGFYTLAVDTGQNEHRDDRGMLPPPTRMGSSLLSRTSLFRTQCDTLQGHVLAFVADALANAHTQEHHTDYAWSGSTGQDRHKTLLPFRTPPTLDMVQISPPGPLHDYGDGRKELCTY